MRFIGNKENLIEKIYYYLSERNIRGETLFDFFSGTTNVARFFKNKGYKIFSSDLLYFSYCLQRAYIINNTEPLFKKLLPLINIDNYDLFSSALEKVLYYLNKIEPINGFIYNNYSIGGTSKLSQPRMYFSDDNAKKIDAIRLNIESWKNSNFITDDEYFILISCLIESVSFFSNVSGVYSAFQKKWDPRALKSFNIKPITIICNQFQNNVYNLNSMDLIDSINTDILYLDPPYNERQYAPNYHILETIAKYDNPIIHGVTGMRNYDNQKSSFCNKNTALNDLEIITKNAKYKYLLLSYNSEGIMPKEEIKSILSSFGSLELIEFQYNRFKSNNNGPNKNKKHIFEQLYILIHN